MPDSSDKLAAPSGRIRKVLVVDDNVDAADVLGDALAASGYEVKIAHDAPSALEIAETFAPQLALLDIGLPVMDGYELGERLKRLPGLSNLELVAVTGYGQLRDRRRSRTAGFREHLVKPIDFSRLVALIPGLVSPAVEPTTV
jgi:CheY-like chemotaxis protein